MPRKNRPEIVSADEAPHTRPHHRPPRRPEGTTADPVRSVRCSDEVWDRAKRRAEHEGVTLSYVVQTMLDGYGRGLVNLPKVVLRYDRSTE